MALLLTTVLVVSCAPAGPGAAPGPLDTAKAPPLLESEVLVRRLGDPAFGVREEAYRRLLDRAAEDPEAVLSALPVADPDPEVQYRVEELRRRVPWEPYRRRADLLAGQSADMKAAVEMLFAELYRSGQFVPVDDWFSDNKALALQRALVIARAGFLEAEHPMV